MIQILASAGAPSGTPVLAFVTTIHCALTVLRRHRMVGGPLVLGPSLLFTLFPWFLPAPFWLLLGLAAHLAWFLACEKLLARPAAQSPAAVTPAAVAAVVPAATPKPAARKGAFAPVRVLAAFDETPEIRTFRFTRPDGFAFQPGQFVIVRNQIGGKAVSRCYSICTPPSCEGYLEISVRRQGLVSSHLHETVRPGAELTITGPGGAFVYPRGARPLVLVAGGIGATPLISMLRHGLVADPSRRIALILSAKEEGAVPFRDELRVLARRHPQFSLAITLTANPAAGYHTGRIGRELIEAVAGDVRAPEYLVCGPLAMIDASRELLASLGVSASQIHFEKFETATAAAAAASAAPAAAMARVTFRMTRTVADAAPGKSLLDVAEAAGVPIQSMCRAGVCGTCRTRLLEGAVDGDFDALDHADRAAGWVLACVARPAGNCVVEA